MTKRCLACGQEKGEFEKHHYPIPKRHGGKETILLCRTCHNLVSRIPLREWPQEVYQAAISSNLEGPALLAFLKVVEKFYEPAEQENGLDE